jgi:hypothetical protein
MLYSSDCPVVTGTYCQRNLSEIHIIFIIQIHFARSEPGAVKMKWEKLQVSLSSQFEMMGLT